MVTNFKRKPCYGYAKSLFNSSLFSLWKILGRWPCALGLAQLSGRKSRACIFFFLIVGVCIKLDDMCERPESTLVHTTVATPHPGSSPFLHNITAPKVSLGGLGMRHCSGFQTRRLLHKFQILYGFTLVLAFQGRNSVPNSATCTIRGSGRNNAKKKEGGMHERCDHSEQKHSYFIALHASVCNHGAERRLNRG